MNNQRLSRLVVALVILVACSTGLMYLGTGLTHLAAPVFHSHAQRSADAAMQNWQHQVAYADLEGKTPQQVAAFLDKQGVGHSDFAGGSTTGFLFASIGPVSRAIELTGPLQGSVSLYVATTFIFDGKHHCITQTIYTEERSA